MLPKSETMRAYASILEKPQYDTRGFKLATGEVVEAACAALRVCARLKDAVEAASYQGGNHLIETVKGELK